MVHDQIKKDHVLTLGIEEEFQIVAIWFRSKQALQSKKALTDENNSFVISRQRITEAEIAERYR
jgi:hypothetical protein